MTVKGERERGHDIGLDGEKVAGWRAGWLDGGLAAWLRMKEVGSFCLGGSGETKVMI